MITRRRAPGPRYAALLALLRTADALWNASRVFFARWDLGPSQFNVLNLIADRPAGLSQVELSRELLVHRSNVTGLVDRLEARGLVRRREQAGDRRAYRVRITPAGRTLMQEILPRYYEVAEAVWGEITAARAREVAAVLGQIAAQAGRLAGPGGEAGP
jgi:DNA-binding MarR family transcriptional regulator